MIEKLENTLKDIINSFFTKSPLKLYSNIIQINHNPKEINDKGPKIAVYLFSENSPNKNYDSIISDIIEKKILIIPIITNGYNIDNLPQYIKEINWFKWEGLNPEKKIAQIILESLGLGENDRRLFLSYRRKDGSEMAEQLYDELLRNNFDVFLDKYSIRLGNVVQEKIHEALDDKAFLLVLESPEAHNSDWMVEEINHAISESIPILILSWVSGKEEKIIDTYNYPRICLLDDDIVKKNGQVILKKEKLEDISRRIEFSHIEGLERRKVNYIDSILRIAQDLYDDCIYYDLNLLRLKNGSKNRSNKLIHVSCRIPNYPQIYSFDNFNTQDQCDKIMIHPHCQVSELRRNILDWVLKKKTVSLRSINQIGEILK